MVIVDNDYMILRLYILRIGKRNEKCAYKIAYGVVTQSVNKTGDAIFSDFTSFGTYGKKCSLGTILLALESDVIISIYEELLKGISLKSVFQKWGVNTNDMEYDVSYTQVYTLVPWSEEHIADYQINYTRAACMLNPQSLFEEVGIDEKTSLKALHDLEKAIAGRTDFSILQMQDRIGNLEIIIAPARDRQGKSLVNCELIKDNPFVQKIEVNSQLSDQYDKITTNVRIISGGKIFIDRIKTAEVVKGRDTVFEFDSEQPVGTAIIKMWGMKGNESFLFHNATYHYIQKIIFNTEIAGGCIEANTEWLEKLKDNGTKKQKAKVDEAKKIEQKSSETYTIEDPVYSQWLRRKKLFKPVIKTNDVYFSKGWDNESDDNGKLCFLDWFKHKSKGATDVFIQDPYFEDVALFFIASADVDCNYIVLTQTHLKTNNDGTDDEVPDGVIPVRRIVIKQCILKNPSLFCKIKLLIKDIPVPDNKLHDRYMFFSYPNGVKEAYALSNSIQGSTVKQPLLITQIGDNAYGKIEENLNDILSKNSIETIYDYRDREKLPLNKISEIADYGFYKWLVPQYKKALRGEVKEILNDAISWKTKEKLSTLGYCLAQIPECKNYQMIEAACRIISSEKRWVDVLKDFILVQHYSMYPIGYIGCPQRRNSFRNPSLLLELEYNEIVSRHNLYFLEYAGMDSDTYGVWGQYFACSVLVKVSPENAIDVLKQFRPTLEEIKCDKQVEPIYKITNVLLHAIFTHAAFVKNKELMNHLLQDNEEWCRALGALMLLYYSRDINYNVDDSLDRVNNTNELIQICKTAWSVQYNIAEINKFYSRLVSTYENNVSVENILSEFVNILQDAYVVEYKVDFAKYIIIPLTNKGLFTIDDVCRNLIESLFEACVSEKKAVSMRGVLPSVLRSLNGDISSFEKLSKELLQKFKKKVQAIVVPDDNKLFVSSIEVINLRNLLIDILHIYDDNNPQMVIINGLLNEVDKELDKIGLDKAKLRFE